MAKLIFNQRFAKIALIISSILILLSIIITIFLLKTADISKEELGPSPFYVDESKILEVSSEYQLLIEIGQKIQGYEEFYKNYEINFKSPEITVLYLQKYLEKNKDIIEEINFDLILNCNFPRLKFMDDTDETPIEGYKYLQRIMRLMQNRITYYTLTNNFEGAKNDLILSNKITDELFKKTSSGLFAMLIISIKLMELDNIKLIMNRGFTEDQKLEILSIKQNHVSTQSLKTLFHFVVQNQQELMHLISGPQSKKPPSLLMEMPAPIYSSFHYKPNKTAKLLRNIGLDFISYIETPSNGSYTKLLAYNNLSARSMEFFEGNLGGKEFINSELFIWKKITQEILIIDNMCNQLSIAQKLLEYKKETGLLPSNLSDLKIDLIYYTDFITGDPFLYSAHNGILQSLGKTKKYWDYSLISKDLSTEEVQEKLTEGLYGYILYLK